MRSTRLIVGLFLAVLGTLFITQATCAPKIRVAVQTASNAEALGAGASVPATGPGGVNGAELWLDATDNSTLWIERDGTRVTHPSVDSVDAVGTWDDKSGSGNHMRANLAGREGLYRTNQLNSLPAVQFATTDWLENDAGSSGLDVERNEAYTIYCIWAPSGVLVSGGAVLSKATSSAQGYWFGWSGQGVFSTLRQGGATGIEPLTGAIVAPASFVSMDQVYTAATETTPDVTIRVNGVARSTTEQLSGNFSGGSTLNSHVASVARLADTFNNITHDGLYINISFATHFA